MFNSRLYYTSNWRLTEVKQLDGTVSVSAYTSRYTDLNRFMEHHKIQSLLWPRILNY
jgi:hypothetical protein